MSAPLEYHLPLAARTVTANSDTVGGANPINGLWGDANTIVAALRCTAASGTTPTLDVTIQSTADGTNWDTIITFSQLTTTGAQRVNASAFDVTPKFWAQRLRVLWTIGGTTPSFTFSVDMFGRA